MTRVDFAEAREDSRDARGFGDLAMTLAKRLLRERGWQPDLFAGAIWDTDTGRTDDGVRLGSGFHEVTASLTTAKSQDPLVFVGGELERLHRQRVDVERPQDQRRRQLLHHIDEHQEPGGEQAAPHQGRVDAQQDAARPAAEAADGVVEARPDPGLLR